MPLTRTIEEVLRGSPPTSSHQVDNAEMATLLQELLDQKTVNTLTDTFAAWEANNPVLVEGMIAIATDKGDLRIGDGTTAWRDLQSVVMGHRSLPQPDGFFANDANPPAFGRGPVRLHGGKGADFDFRSRGTNDSITLTSWVHFGDEGNNIFYPTGAATLSTGVGSADTTIPLTDTSAFAAGEHIRIGAEMILIGAISGSDLTGCTRGQLGTAATTHNSGDNVHAQITGAGTRLWWAQGQSAFFFDTDQGNAVVGATVSADGGGAGVAGFGRVDQANPAHEMWGGYFEGIRGANTEGQGSVWGNEIAVMNFAANHPGGIARMGGRPYLQGWQGQTLGLLLQAGGGNTNANNADNPLVIAKAGASFHRGIVFEDGSIVDPAGAGESEAILLPKGYKITWYEPGDSPAFDMLCNVSDPAKAQQVVVNDFGLSFGHMNGQAMFFVPFITGSVNRTSLVPSATGDAVEIIAEGADTNVSLNVLPKGAGTVVVGNVFPSRAAALLAHIPAQVKRIHVRGPDGLTLSYVRAAAAAALSTADGAHWSPDGPTYVEHYGAVGDHVNDASPGADDTSAIQAALDAGGIVNAMRRYRSTSPLVLNKRGTLLLMPPPERNNNSSINAAGVITGDFTAGPVVHLNASFTAVKGGAIEASAARQAAAITTGAGNINCGILAEPDDDGSDIQEIDIAETVVSDQPADGIAFEGPITSVRISVPRPVRNGRHGLTITQGELSGRTNKSRPGIFTIMGGDYFDNGGHGIAVGHPSSGSKQPYRVRMINSESYRNALDLSMRYVAAGDYFVGENIYGLNGASGGTIANNVATHKVAYLAGKDVTLAGWRYINSAGAETVEIGTIAGIGTEGVRLSGKAATTGAPPAVFAKIDSAASNVEIALADHDNAALVTTPVSATGVRTITQSGDMEIYNASITQPDLGINTLFISAGAITLPSPRPISGRFVVNADTEAAAATDNLTDIVGGQAGDMLVLGNANSTRIVTVVENVGNIRLAGSNYNFGAAGTSGSNILTLICDGTNWLEIARANN